MTSNTPQGWKALLETQNYDPQLAGKIANQMIAWHLTPANYHTLAVLSGGRIEGTDAYTIISDLRNALNPPANVVQMVAPEAPEVVNVQRPADRPTPPKPKAKRKSKKTESKET